MGASGWLAGVQRPGARASRDASKVNTGQARRVVNGCARRVAFAAALADLWHLPGWALFSACSVVMEECIMRDHHWIQLRHATQKSPGSERARERELTRTASLDLTLITSQWQSHAHQPTKVRQWRGDNACLTRTEHAPLLAGGDDEQDQQQQGGKILGVYDPSRPLTRLEKVLGAVALLFLILSATFIGLFAGTEHTLKKERSKHGDPVTYTSTVTATRTVPPGGEPTGKPAVVSPSLQGCMR